MHLANHLKNLLANKGQLASETIIQLSSTIILTSQYFPKIIFFDQVLRILIKAMTGFDNSHF